MEDQQNVNVNEENNNTDTATAAETNAENNESKTFTQAEVNRLMKAEKEKGKRSVLKDLGVEDVKDAKSALEEYQKHLDSQKTEAQKTTEQLNNLAAELQKANAKAERFENCLTALSLGADHESVAELVLIAMSKVTEEKDLKTVISEMKTQKAYSGFFDTSTEKQGTGTPVPSGHKGISGGSTENYGARLAKQKKQSLKNINGG